MLALVICDNFDYKFIMLQGNGGCCMGLMPKSLERLHQKFYLRLPLFLVARGIRVLSPQFT